MAVKGFQLAVEETMEIGDIRELIDNADSDAELYVEVDGVTYNVDKVKSTYSNGGVTEITLVAEE